MKHDETLQKLGIFTISTGAGFQDVFTQQYAGMTKNSEPEKWRKFHEKQHWIE